MTMHRFFVAVALAAVAALAGCGTSGSDPTEFAEVRFIVEPSAGGLAQFTVTSLIDGGLTHPSFTGQQFSITAPFTLALLNAPLPFSASFQQIGTAPIAVTSVVSGQSQTGPIPSTGPNSVVTMQGGGSSSTPIPASPEIYFTVCAPLPGSSSCLTPDDGGIGGIGFSGTVGDAFTTHLLPNACSTTGGAQPCTATPSIYFIEDARDSINAVFTGGTSQTLLVQMFSNGQLRQTKIGTDDLVMREDL